MDGLGSVKQRIDGILRMVFLLMLPMIAFVLMLNTLLWLYLWLDDDCAEGFLIASFAVMCLWVAGVVSNAIASAIKDAIRKRKDKRK